MESRLQHYVLFPVILTQNLLLTVPLCKRIKGFPPLSRSVCVHESICMNKHTLRFKFPPRHLLIMSDWDRTGNLGYSVSFGLVCQSIMSSRRLGVGRGVVIIAPHLPAKPSCTIKATRVSSY